MTLGKATLKIVWREEYFKGKVEDFGKDLNEIKLSRKEYIAVRNEQRRIYSTQKLSKEFMSKSYSVEGIGLKHKKRRVIIVGVLIALILSMLTESGGIYLALFYEAIFVPMFVLWLPEYKDAKILQQAYDRAMSENMDECNN